VEEVEAEVQGKTEASRTVTPKPARKRELQSLFHEVGNLIKLNPANNLNESGDGYSYQVSR
jgi:hypothetical protein